MGGDVGVEGKTYVTFYSWPDKYPTFSILEEKRSTRYSLRIETTDEGGSTVSAGEKETIKMTS